MKTTDSQLRDGEARDLTPQTLAKQIAAHSSPSMLANVRAAKMVKMTSPMGQTTEVPAGLVDALTHSGYVRS